MSGCGLSTSFGWKAIQTFAPVTCDENGGTYTPSGNYSNVHVRNTGTNSDAYLGTDSDPDTGRGLLLEPGEWREFAQIEKGFTIPYKAETGKSTTLVFTEG